VRGYAATTTNHVAAEAGVSIGSLYEYYPSKDALVVAILEAHIAEATSVLEAAAATVRARPAASLEWTIGTFVAAMVRLHASDPGLHRVLFEEAPLPARVRRTLAGVESAMVAETAELLRRHAGVRVADPALAAALVVRTVEALTHHHVLLDPTGAVDDVRWAREVTAMVTRYLEGAPRPRAR
jgi:AcrR family transcriptional regulator